MSKIKITFDARMSEHTGIGTYVQNLLREISTDDSIDLRIICKSKNSLQFSGRPEILHCNTDIYTIKEQFDLIKYFPKDKENEYFWSPHINIPLFYRGPNLIVTVHDLLFFEREYFPQSTAKNIYRDLFYSALTKKAKLIFTPSAFTQAELTRRFPVALGKVQVTPLGVASRWKVPPTNNKQKSIVFIGNLKRNKNLGLLIEAFNKIKSQVPHNLHIIGASRGLRTSENMNKFDLDQNRMIIEERLTDSALVQKVQQADLVVCPSLYEGFGLVPLEAYTAGTKVLCSDIPVHKEVMGDFAHFFKTGDSESCAKEIMNALSNDCNFQTDEIVRKYDWGNSAKSSIEKLAQVSR